MINPQNGLVRTSPTAFIWVQTRSRFVVGPFWFVQLVTGVSPLSVVLSTCVHR